MKFKWKRDYQSGQFTNKVYYTTLTLGSMWFKVYINEVNVKFKKDCLSRKRKDKYQFIPHVDYNITILLHNTEIYDSISCGYNPLDKENLKEVKCYAIDALYDQIEMIVENSATFLKENSTGRPLPTSLQYEEMYNELENQREK